MNPLAQAITGALLQFVWQGFVVLFFASAATFLLRKRGPNARYLVYCVALLVLAVLPVITAVGLYDPLPRNSGAAAVTLTIRGVWSGSLSPFAVLVDRALTALQPWILRFWMFGVVFLSMRLAWLGLRVSSLRRSGSPPDTLILALANAMARRMGMRRVVRVLVSAIPEGPSVAGWIRPVILLPAATVLNLTPDQLEAILAHEIAHLRRYDDVVNLAQSVIETLLFYHPAVWWISNRIRHERELCCDDLAVRASGNALCYARALTSLERLRLGSRGLALGALGTAGSPLEYRIRRIVDAGRHDYIPASLPGVLALSVALILIAIYSNPAHGSAPESPALVEYPESARAEGIQGTVPVQVEIDDVGRVSAAQAMGGPRELRQAAVQSASALRFPPADLPASERVDVAFELTTPVPVQPAQPPTPAVYPPTEPGNQRTFMTAQSLLALMGSAYEKTDPAVLAAGRKAGLQLAGHLNEYFGDSARPAGTSPDIWAKARRESELRIHAVLAYIAQTEKDYETAEAELKLSLAIDPEQAGASYQLGTTILQEMVANNEITRYSEAIYGFARSLAVTGPAALPPDLKVLAESALKENYGSYHGSTDGLDELMKLAGGSTLPPAGFHIMSAAELNDPVYKAHSDWAAAYPDLDRWETMRAALFERGDSHLENLRGHDAPLTFKAVVVSQLSANRILVNVDDAAGDAVLRLDAASLKAVRPGTAVEFTGVVDSYALDPYILTFLIRDPAHDIEVRSTGKTPRPTGLLTRVLSGLRRLARHLA